MYQVVIEKATGVIRRAGYTDFMDSVDPDLFEIQTYDDKPSGLMVQPFLTPEEQIALGRRAMSDLYLSAPIALQKVFAPVLAQVFPALDMRAYDLAIALVEEAPLSVVSDADMLTLAQAVQSQILDNLNQLKALTG